MNIFEETPCPSCESTKFVIWAKSKTIARYVKCRACGTIYANPRPIMEKRRGWINDAFTLSKAWSDAMEARRNALTLEASFIRSYLKTGRLLDVGCSTGLLFEFFPEEQWQRYGVELSPSTAEYARKTHQAEVFAGDLCEAKFDPQSFDLVTLIDTLCLLDNPYKDLKEVHHILRDGGFLAVELPGLAYISQRIRGILPLLLSGRWIQVDSDSSYIAWHSPYGLNLLMKRCGFEPIAHMVVPSPTRNTPIGWLSKIHFKLISWLVSIHPYFLTWAPKYIYIARATRIS